jgi:hypothetical protein
MMLCGLKHTGNRRKLMQEQQSIKASAAAQPKKEVSG